MNFIGLQTFIDDWGNQRDFDKNDYENHYQWTLEEGLSISNFYLDTGIISKETEEKIRESFDNYKSSLKSFSKYSLKDLITITNTEELIEELSNVENECMDNANLFLKTYCNIKGESFLEKGFKRECNDLRNKFRTMEHVMRKLIDLITDYPKYLSFCEEYVKNSFLSFSTEEEIDLAIKRVNTKLKSENKSSIEYFYLKAEREAMYEYKIAFTKSHCGFY